MGYPRHRETLAAAAAPADCYESHLALLELVESIRGRRICVIGPLGGSPKNCDIIGAPEGGLPQLLSLGMSPLYLTTDLDADLKYLFMAIQATRYVLVHVHGDNMARLAQIGGLLSRRGVIYTTQVEPLACVAGLGGFTDGDRAVVLPLIAGAREVLAIGYDFVRPSHDHKAFPSNEKEKKLRIASEILSRASSMLGYTMEVREKLIVFKSR